MVSAERVLGYCRVPQEANLESEVERKPEDDWPAKGTIEVSGLMFRRRAIESETALRVAQWIAVFFLRWLDHFVFQVPLFRFSEWGPSPAHPLSPS